MRVNVYAEELTDRVEIISKTTEAGSFVGLRIYLELPISVPAGSGHNITHRGPFIRRSGDDDSSAVTIWTSAESVGLRQVLQKALNELEKYHQRLKGGVISAPGKSSYTFSTVGDCCRHGYPRNEVCPVSQTKPCE